MSQKRCRGSANPASVFLVPCLAAASLTAQPRTAWGWATAEHIRFGQQIAKPFEARLKLLHLPVIAAPRDSLTGIGPETFGDYVSAPDFGRGLSKLLKQKPSAPGALGHCGRFWNREGVVDGEPLHDQAHASIDPNSPEANLRPGWADCINGWRTNNSHFGDFAANHYMYHHRLALQAAERYRRTRQPQCQKAAYTLEGWGQHYLTDSVASGHAWNPPGSYDIEWGFQTLEAVQVRMRIHDYLNEHGANMAGPSYAWGTFWGDHSETHTANRKSIPEQAEGHRQKELTLRLSRMGLGQVVAAAECGATPRADDVLTSRDQLTDARRVYASDESMCLAMYGHEITWRWWLPDGEGVPEPFNDIDIDVWGLDIAQVTEAVRRCKWDNGQMSRGQDGHWLARYYFNDKRPFLDDYQVSPTIDSSAELTLDELGCGANLATLPPPSAHAQDACGNTLCELPTRSDGSCPVGYGPVASCCVPMQRRLTRDAYALSTSFGARRLPLVALGNSGASPGAPSEFLWIDHAQDIEALAPNQFGLLPWSAELGGPSGPKLTDCGRTGSYTVYEARVKLPNNAYHDDKALLLRVDEMDEGLMVQLDGRLVRYLKRADGESASTASGTSAVTSRRFTPQYIPLLTVPVVPASGDSHLLRVTHLNSCGAERPLRVRLALGSRVGKGDYVELDPVEEGGCRLSAHQRSSNLPGLLLLLGLWAALRRRRG